MRSEPSTAFDSGHACSYPSPSNASQTLSCLMATAGADGEDGEGAADDANNAAGGAAAGRKQRTHDIVPGATLSSAAALRSKKISLTLDKDPLFRHTTELFDENNPSGMTSRPCVQTRTYTP